MTDSITTSTGPATAGSDRATQQTTGSMLAVPESAQRAKAIEVRGVEKSFRIPNQRLDTLKERAFHLFDRRGYWDLRALQKVDFDVYQGEFFGVVGRNGSGKSTLLKLLASIYRADAGHIRIAGRLAPCIELGVGFNVELSAYDNVVLNGVMMGLSPHEARARFDDIVEFAELGEFTEMKLKNYSSGMLVRLGFSLMTQVDADVLLIDEVLAVGDASFQQKCFDLFARMHKEGKTIVLVTHDMHSVETLCDRAVLLENGRVEAIGEPAEVARRYLEINFPDDAPAAASEDLALAGAPGHARVLSTELLDPAGNPARSFAQGEPIRLEVVVEAEHRLAEPVFGFQIVNGDDLLVFAPKPFPVNGRRPVEAGERVRFSAEVSNPLAPGHYFVNCAVGHSPDEPRPIAFRRNAADFMVFGTDGFGGVVALDVEADVVGEGPAS